MKKILLIIIIFFPLFSVAGSETKKEDQIFKAEVVSVIEEKAVFSENGAKNIQQDLRLRALEGDLKGREIIFKGIGEIEVLKNNAYKTGDKVLMAASYDDRGNPSYYVTDYVRTNSLIWLAAFFFISLAVVGGFKGLRSLLSLVLTFFIIVKFIIPQILSGSNPLLATLLGSFFILLVIIYFTEGFSSRSHLSIFAIFISLIITVLVSWLFVSLARLSGAAGEDVIFLLDIGGQAVNFKGLLLAGIIIGSLGVLDDVVISQVRTVEEVAKANPYLGRKDLFRHAYRVGVSHISSMTNTLFLAYAGVSLPLLILFISGQSAFANFGQIMNSEIISAEIVRTLAGSIGLVLSVPIATFLAAYWHKK